MCMAHAATLCLMSTALQHLQAYHRELRYHALLAWFTLRWEYRVARHRMGRLGACRAAVHAVRHAPPVPF
jgi:hypothetical protein